jgi:hypothetical protein
MEANVLAFYFVGNINSNEFNLSFSSSFDSCYCEPNKRNINDVEK